MAKQVLVKVRPSASLILLAKDNSIAPSIFDYNALLLTRNSKSSFMPDSSVFPGGVCDAEDSSPAWLKHFQRYDIGAAKLRELCPIASSLTDSSKETLNSAISLRLSALRETFEEMGILLCRDRKTLTSTDGYAQFNEQFDRKHWQHEVHNNPSKFLALCEELDVLPDLWSLHEWSAWRTPSTFKSRRFETTFFLTALKEQPKVLSEPNEVKDYAWRSPLDYLKSAIKKQVWLPPPQYYELSRCLNFQSLEQLRQFAQLRGAKCNVLIAQPVLYQCTDGIVQLLPGDDMYPDNPDASTDRIETGLSTEAFRALAKNNVNRTENKDKYETRLLINYHLADGQINPLDPKDF
ncbi:nucleoside diphosphate-linked moiety X motif 19 [Drosophila grimshawi]|uniref:GH10625 n=1 Tax=Drosophila grimshawi TaxID=7222 RepID=B4JCV6_DROGR|nr:nucleoside diphosphate-linked moiety X motif 19 [Drosophila grimshawi]EDW03195.1 GH10625 [Drosophila grimshawi]